MTHSKQNRLSLLISLYLFGIDAKQIGPMSSMPNCLLIPTMDPHYNFFAFDYLTKKLFIKQQQQQQNNRREKKKEAAEVRTLNDRSSELALLMTKRKVYVIYIFRWKKMSFGTGQLKF